MQLAWETWKRHKKFGLENLKEKDH